MPMVSVRTVLALLPLDRSRCVETIVGTIQLGAFVGVCAMHLEEFSGRCCCGGHRARNELSTTYQVVPVIKFEYRQRPCDRQQQ